MSSKNMNALGGIVSPLVNVMVTPGAVHNLLFLPSDTTDMFMDLKPSLVHQLYGVSLQTLNDTI